MHADGDRREETRKGYDRLAEEYAKRIGGELAGKPLDRALLRCFVEQVGDGPVCDLGCGPGHVARFLHDLGADVCGIDLSPRMVEVATRLHPGIAFRTGDFLDLAEPDGAFGGVVAFYSLIHAAGPALDRALAGIRRVLRPGGLLLAAFHVGEETVHRDELWGVPVDLDFHFFMPDEFAGRLLNGFTVEALVTRAPYPDVEHPSQRAYVLARTAPRAERP